MAEVVTVDVGTIDSVDAYRAEAKRFVTILVCSEDVV